MKKHFLISAGALALALVVSVWAQDWDQRVAIATGSYMDSNAVECGVVDASESYATAAAASSFRGDVIIKNWTSGSTIYVSGGEISGGSVTTAKLVSDGYPLTYGESLTLGAMTDGISCWSTTSAKIRVLEGKVR